jgi:DNA-binding HxlR family transcriptional regulator
LILGIDSLIRAVANSLTADTAQEPSMLLSEAIDKTDLRILCELNKYKHTLKLFDLASAQDLPSPKILSKRLGRLVKLRLAIRRGERSGWTLTAKGRDAIAKTTH